MFDIHLKMTAKTAGLLIDLLSWHVYSTGPVDDSEDELVVVLDSIREQMEQQQ